MRLSHDNSELLIEWRGGVGGIADLAGDDRTKIATTAVCKVLIARSFVCFEWEAAPPRSAMKSRPPMSDMGPSSCPGATTNDGRDSIVRSAYGRVGWEALNFYCSGIVLEVAADTQLRA
jgi:hypothetical protein